MKEIKYGVLLDYYGELLTEKQRSALDLYYNEDLSLLEIGEHLSISRQGVHECIKKGCEHLEEYESVLHLYEKEMQKEIVKEQISKKLSGLDEKIINEISELIDRL